MKIVRYSNLNGEAHFGYLEKNNVYEALGEPLKEFKKGKNVGSLDSLKLLAPCSPSKVIAIAINFPGIEKYSPLMKEPLVFIKPGTCIANPYDQIVNPFSDLPWWGEAELAVVIKKKMRNVSDDNVRENVLGFTIGNDVTVENIEERDHHLARSKCADAFCPVGPWIDTEFDATDCLIEAVQNGEVIRRGRSSQQVWQWPKIISWLSTWMTLEPWDIVLTGNPPDTVGMRYVNHGDIYTARIEGLGELTNKFLLRQTNHG